MNLTRSERHPQDWIKTCHFHNHFIINEPMAPHAADPQNKLICIEKRIRIVGWARLKRFKKQPFLFSIDLVGRFC